MGRVEKDFGGFLVPLRWLQEKSKRTNFIGKGILFLGGMGYLFSLIIFAIAILPLLWLYEKIV